jgi:DNA-dependent protein kinase catalytic subunit
LLKENDKKIDLPKLIITAITLKNLQEAAVRTLELIQKVTVFHPLFVKPFSKNVIDVCLQTIKCHEPSARFKEMAVKTLDEILSRDALPDDDKNAKISAVIKVLLSVFDQDVKSRLFNNTFELLGKISKMFPDQFTPESAKKLLDKMLTVIQNLFKDDKASVSLILISGAVEGLRNHLENFTPKDNEDAHFKKRLYECMLLLSDPFKHSNINSDSNRVAFRNMLSVVTHYSHLVNELIYEDHSKWHAIMLQWIASKNYDDKNAGVHCMQAIHVEIGKCLEKENNPADKAILLFYMNYFQKTLESPQSQPHEIRIAIKGFGSMAGAAKILLEPGYLNERFDLVMQRTEYSYYVGNKMKRREVLEHLPNYIEALSKIINQIDEISGIQLHSLQAICVILVKDFYFLSTSHHNLVAAGLLETFANLEKTGGKVFSDTVESITWQGILWTCSHQLTYDLESNYENIKDWKDTITYKRYLPLWSRLLKPSDERHKRICSSIYEHFIKSLFQIIDKLNLDTKKRKYHDESTNADIEFFFTDPSLDLEAVRPEDFQILYNLTQFYNDIITHQTNEELEANLSEWLDHWLEKSISLALKHPLVSAFMYLIEIALRVMERLDYIRTKSIDSRFSESRLMETLSSYIKSLFSRSKQVSDELQIACLRLIFQSPIVILKEHIEETISVLITGFSVGKSVINLAHHALTCYQNMIGEYNSDPKMRRRLLEEVLPHLETFLSSGKELATDSELRELKYKRQRKRIVLQSVDTDLMKLKKRILLLLGTCTPEESQLILTSFQQKLTRDYITNIFDITLHCDDELAPLIHLDQIIERVCHIALHSSDRPTKISGCELVHGMVLYMMGKNLKKSETLPIWKDLCKNIIILGAEKDQTIRALFEPLLMQMMHYYSKPDQILSPLSTVMIEAVLEMISYRDNSIQDLSARLLREYIIWLMRQTSKEQRKLSPITLVDFFHELKKMSIETEQ